MKSLKGGGAWQPEGSLGTLVLYSPAGSLGGGSTPPLQYSLFGTNMPKVLKALDNSYLFHLVSPSPSQKLGRGKV